MKFSHSQPFIKVRSYFEVPEQLWQVPEAFRQLPEGLWQMIERFQKVIE